MIIHPEKLSGTASSGGLSVNTNSRLKGLLRQVVIKPTTNPTYNFKIENEDSLTIFCEESITGEYANEVVIPVTNTCTFIVENSTRDELFTIHLVVQE